MKEKLNRVWSALIALGAKGVEITHLEDEDVMRVKALLSRGKMQSNFWFYLPGAYVRAREPAEIAAEAFSALRAEAESVFDQLCVR